MDENKAIAKIQAFVAQTPGLEDTFLWVLADQKRFASDLADMRTYGGGLLDYLRGLIDHDHLYDVLRDSLRDVYDYQVWFDLNNRAFDFVHTLIDEMKQSDG